MIDRFDVEHSKNVHTTNVESDEHNNTELDEAAVLSLTNSIVQSLYTEEGTDFDQSNISRKNEQPEEEHRTEESHATGNGENDGEDVDYHFDQEALINNLAGSVVDSLESQIHEEYLGESVQVEERETCSEAPEEDRDIDISKVEEKRRELLSNDASETPADYQETSIVNEKDNNLEEIIADTFREQFQVNSSQQQAKEGNAAQEKDVMNLALVNAINEAFENNTQNEDNNGKKKKQKESDSSENGNNTEVMSKGVQDKNIDDTLKNVDLSLNNAINYVLEDRANADQATSVPLERPAEADVVHDEENPEQHEDYQHEAELDLNAAIADALKTTESVLENRNHNEMEHAEENNHSFDNFYQDMQKLVENTVSEVEKHESRSLTNEDEGDSSNIKSKNAEGVTTDIEGVIHDIDLNDVLATALKDTQTKTTDYDVNVELNKAIQEALLSVPGTKTKKKSARKSQPKKKTIKSTNNERKKASKATDKLSALNDDLSAELTSAITDALKDTELTDQNKSISTMQSTTNESEFEKALKTVVNDVVEHNLIERRDDAEEQAGESVSVDEKDGDYNWDDIMDKAFEMAMEYPSDLSLQVDQADLQRDHLIDKVTAPFLHSASSTTTRRVSSQSQPITFIQNVNVERHRSDFDRNPTVKKQKSKLASSPIPSKSSVAAIVGNLLGSLDLSTIGKEDLRKLKISQLDMIKKNVSSTLATLMSNNHQSTKEVKTTKTMDEKERIRYENRERKKRWREFNTERNRDIDLRTRVIKRANHLYPLPEHEELRKQWISTEFHKRKQKRLERQQKQHATFVDMKNYDSKDALPFDIFFKNKENLSKIAEIYNQIGGNVSAEKLLLPSSDKIISISSIVSALVVAYILKNEGSTEDKTIQSITQSLVVSFDRFLSSLSKDQSETVEAKNTSGSSTPSDWNSTTDSYDLAFDLSSVKKSANSLSEHALEKHSSVDTGNTLKIAPVSGGVTFKVQSQNTENMQVERPTYTADADLTRLVKEKNSNFSKPSKPIENRLHASASDVVGAVAKGAKKSSNAKPKRKTTATVAINIEKFLSPQPPDASLLQKIKSDEKKRKREEEVKDTPEAVSVKRRLSSDISEDGQSKNEKNDVKPLTVGEQKTDVLKTVGTGHAKRPTVVDVDAGRETTRKTVTQNSRQHSAAPKVIPSIPLPQYGMPSSSKIGTAGVRKAPISLKKAGVGLPLQEEKVATTNRPPSIMGGISGLKRPGAFRKPGAFRRPSEVGGYRIIKPFGGITPIKKV